MDCRARVEQHTVESDEACKSLLHLSKAVEQVGEAIILLDTKGLIQYVNPAFEKITGYKPEEVSGKHLELLSSDRDESFYEGVWEQLKRGEVWTGRIIEKKRDETIYCSDTTISPVFDSLGAILSYVAIKRDVTRDVAIEAQLRQAQKLEAIGILAGGIAHDFNNILGAAMLFTELAMEEISAEHEARKDLEEVLESCRRGKKLIDQMLTFSRSRSGKYERVQLSPIVKETVRFLRACLPANIEIQSRFEISPPDSDSVLADPTAIHRLLLNLGTNAAHAMRKKGGVLSISLTTAQMGREELDRLNPDLRPGTFLKLEVNDSGHGIEPEIMEQIFTPFFTTKKTGQGSGMGLSVAHGIVSNHRGSMTVRSKPGETSFRIYFPVATPELSDKRDEPAQILRGNEEILLVDDEQAIVKSALRTLKSLGYRATGCSTPAEALKIFAERPESFDLVITDLTMPSMLGTELARELTLIRPEIPIILLTGYGHSVDEAEAESAGIRKTLQKPAYRKDLAKAIREVLDGENR